MSRMLTLKNNDHFWKASQEYWQDTDSDDCTVFEYASIAR